MGISIISSGGGGGTLPHGADVEVSDGIQATLVSALSSATIGVYISADLTITSTVTLPSKNLIIKPGVTITATAAVLATPMFTTSSEPFISNEEEAFIHCDHTGAIFAATGSGFYTQRGVLSYDCSLGATIGTFSDNCVGDFDTARVTDVANTIAQWYGTFNGRGASFRRIHFTGAGSSCRIFLRGIRALEVELDGAWLAYTSAAGTQSCLKVTDSSVEKVIFSMSTDDHCLNINDGRVGVLEVIPGSSQFAALTSGGLLTSVVPDDAVTIVGNGSSSSTECYGFGNYSALDLEAGSSRLFFFGVGFNASPNGIANLSKSVFLGGYQSTTESLRSSADEVDFVGYQFGNTLTIDSGSTKHRFTNCRFESALTVPSGALCSFVNCRFSNNLTIDNGADSDFTNCEIAGTYTNNDSGSRIQSCRNAGTSVSDV